MASADVWSALPYRTWSTSPGSTPAASIAARPETVARSVAVSFLSVPPKPPNGVRLADRNTTSARPASSLPGAIIPRLLTQPGSITRISPGVEPPFPSTQKG